VVAALLVAHRSCGRDFPFTPWRCLLAGLSESIFLMRLGADDPWPSGPGDCGGGGGADPYRWRAPAGAAALGRWGARGAAVLLGILFIVPGLARAL
jgi:hypothetical protein